VVEILANGSLGPLGEIVAPLQVWTKKSGLVTMGTVAANVALMDVSADGNLMLYAGNVSFSTSSVDFYIGGTDGTGITPLVQNVDLDWSPTMRFAGSFAVASYSIVGATPAGLHTVSTWTLPGLQRTDLLSDAYDPFATDLQATEVATNSVNGLMLFPIAGGSGTLIDPIGALPYFDPTGQRLFYLTNNGGLATSSIVNPAPISLFSGVEEVRAVSPDGQTAVVAKNAPSFLSDLYLVSTTTPGVVTTIAPTPVAATDESEGFASTYTIDSSHVIYFSSYDATKGVGVLSSIAVNGSTPTTYSPSVSRAVAYGTSSKIVFDVLPNPSIGSADLFWVDTAASGPPTLIAQQIRVFHCLAGGKTEVVYASPAPAPLGGIYVYPLP
jgi:hypothetical protein